jgi:hypothetical protein
VELEMIIDGKDIPINDFVQKIIASIVSGAAECLNGVEDNWTEINLTITR